jgi:hypothetical protein
VLICFYLSSVQLFSADSTVFSKKKFDLFFAHENINKRASIVAHNQPQTFFFTSMYGLAAQTSPELIFHVINMSKTHLSPYLWYLHFCFISKDMNEKTSVFFSTEVS